MTRILIAALLLAGSAAFAQTSDTPEARRSAATTLVKTMDELTGPERMLGTMRQAMTGPLQQMLAKEGRLSAAQQKRAAEVMGDEVTAAMGDQMKEMMPLIYAGMTDLYVERFSLAEIQELQRFYSSATGRKSIDVMMSDMPRLMQPMMARMQTQQAALHARMQAAIERLRAEGIELSPAKK